MRDLISQALRYYQVRQYQKAVSLCNRVLIKSPHSADALNILIQSLFASGQYQIALTTLTTFETHHKSSLWFLQHKANIYRRLKDTDREFSVLQTLNTLCPEDSTVLARIVQVSCVIGEYTCAKNAMDKIELMLGEESEITLNAKVTYYKSTRRYDSALEYSEMLMGSPSRSVNTVQKHAALLRLNGESHTSISVLEEVIQKRPSSSLFLSLANAHSDCGHLVQAEELYKKAIILDESNVDAHINLSSTMWELGKSKTFADSFKPHVQNGSLAFLLAYISALNNAKQFEQAYEQLLLHPSLVNETGYTILMLRSLMGLNLFEKAMRYISSFKGKVVPTALLLEFAIVAFENKAYKNAISLLNDVLKAEKDNQLALAYKYSVLREMGAKDGLDKYYQEFTLFRHLSVSEKSTFIGQLVNSLTGMHLSDRHPLNQTLKNGTQTRGHLFSSKQPDIQALKTEVDSAVFKFMQQQGMDIKRFTNARGAPNYIGSWSVKLKNGGFHSNHIHAHGRISGVVYIALPKTIECKEKKEGWLTLGQPFENGNTNIEPDVMIKPYVSQCVLFRSFVWHGTTPFSALDDRITVAFDVGEYGID